MELKELNIYQRMNLVMKEVDYIKKRVKKDGMKYNFVSHDDVSSLLHDPLAENGIMMIPTIDGYKIEWAKSFKTDYNTKARTEIEEKTHILNMTVHFVNIDKPEDRITVTGCGYAIDNEDKGYGKAMSYALKYVLLKTFLLESGDEDDIDAYQEDSSKKPASKPAPKPLELPKPSVALLTKAQVDEIKALTLDYPDIVEEVKKFAGKVYIRDIEATKYNIILSMIKASIQNQQAQEKGEKYA
jgi:hypothetical protein